MTPRAARIDDAAAIAAIYNEGIADRVATFETQPRSAEQVTRWFDGRHPIIVVEGGDGAVLACRQFHLSRASATPALPNFPSMSRASIAAKSPRGSQWPL